jgi:hypothetical protein
MIGLRGHVILGMNINPNVTSYQYNPDDTWFIDVFHQGKIFSTVNEALDYYTPNYPPRSNTQNDLFSSLSCASILLRTMNNLIFVHNRASTSPSLHFFSKILSYLNTQIHLILSPLLFSTSSSPIPPCRVITSCQWNTTNVAILHKFFMISKNFQLQTIMNQRLNDLEPYLPMSQSLEILYQSYLCFSQTSDQGP